MLRPIGEAPRGTPAGLPEGQVGALREPTEGGFEVKAGRCGVDQEDSRGREGGEVVDPGRNLEAEG